MTLMLPYLAYALLIFLAAWLVGPLLSIPLIPFVTYIAQWRARRKGMPIGQTTSWTKEQREWTWWMTRGLGADAVLLGQAIALGLVSPVFSHFAPNALPSLVLTNASWVVMFLMKDQSIVFPVITVAVSYFVVL